VAASDPFDLVGDREVGVVCVHGFTGSPYEMRYLSEQLARDGATVHGLLLPGHGTSVDDLARAGWRDWTCALDRAVDAMQRRCRRVAVVGQSLGGLLALELAARRPELALVASLAAPLWLDGIAGRAVRWLAGPLGRVVPRIPKLGGSDVRDRIARAENPSYTAIPSRALAELVAGMRAADAALPQITPPVLVIHARRDHTAPVACATRITERTTRARARRLRILPRSFHLIAIDVERDIVAAEVIAFLRRHAAGQLPGDLPCVT